MDTYDLAIIGAGIAGTAIARQLCREGIGVRVIEPNQERAREIAEELPSCRVYHTDGVDPDFVARERIGEGRSMADPLAESKVFPPMVTQMIAVGEESGSLVASSASAARKVRRRMVSVRGSTARPSSARANLPAIRDGAGIPGSPRPRMC